MWLVTIPPAPSSRPVPDSTGLLSDIVRSLYATSLRIYVGAPGRIWAATPSLGFRGTLRGSLWLANFLPMYQQARSRKIEHVECLENAVLYGCFRDAAGWVYSCAPVSVSGKMFVKVQLHRVPKATRR